MRWLIFFVLQIAARSFAMSGSEFEKVWRNSLGRSFKSFDESFIRKALETHRSEKILQKYLLVPQFHETTSENLFHFIIY